MTLNTPKELFDAVVEWDNQHNGGKLQKAKFNIDACQAEGGIHFERSPVQIPEEEWRTLEEHLKIEYFSNWGDHGADLGHLLDRVRDHVKRA